MSRREPGSREQRGQRRIVFATLAPPDSCSAGRLRQGRAGVSEEIASGSNQAIGLKPCPHADPLDIIGRGGKTGALDITRMSQPATRRIPKADSTG
jgi:hypothetical protein